MKKISMMVGGVMMLLAVGCNGDGGESDVTEEAEGTPAPGAPGDEGGEEVEVDTEVAEGTEVVDIGFSGPLSGAGAYYGNNTLNGLTMAIEEINESGGFEVDGEMYSFNLVSLDDQYLPDETGANVRRLVQENDTPVIFVPHSGGTYATQVFNEQDEVLLASYSSEPEITQQDNDLTWRIPPTYDKYIEPFSEYQMERFGTDLAMLPPNSEFGMDWAEALAPAWEEMGGNVVHESSVDYAQDTDFYTLLTNALAEDPDVLFVGGSSEPTAQVMAQAREQGFEGGFLVMDQAKLDEIDNVLGGAPEVIEGSVGVPPLVDDVHEGNEQFISDYQDTFDADPGSEAGYHYYSVYILAEAMAAAGETEDAHAIRESLDEGLQQVDDDKHVYEVSEVDEDGGMVTELRMAVVEDGEVELVDFDD
ncbi:ABC transporter substrate-binding protein [Salicibibacter kimchii]|uniref:Ethanolamine utilization protein EutJ n=1 Tax=Salicibibacter kimchii TaxID=2099786 RepID=A0A345BWR7_9BACI|nr:ABC transporter substrate-binding protein [Salicibibacter kimchii]AXF55398.1 ethanolamine utilization protein EutJ [Salicibibacter kimchii]